MATSWRYRVLRRDGTELTTDLPHTVDSHSQTFGIVRGLWPPKSQIGRLTVPLIPPKGQTQAQAEWAGVNVEALYKQLKYGQRIERYTRATTWSATKAYNRNDVAQTGLAPGTTFEDNSAYVAYSGSWQVWSDPGNSGGTAHYSNSAGDTATFNFTGQYVGVVYLKNINGGIATVKIDGAVVDQLDTYAAAQAFQQQKYYAVTAGPHSISVTVTGAQNPSSTYNWIFLDAFVVVGNNLLSANDASIETDASGWTGIGFMTVSRSTAQALDGAASLAMTGLGAGAGWAKRSPVVAVIPGKSYTAICSVRAATTPTASIITELEWYQADGVTSSAILTETQGTGVADTNTGWTQAFVTGQAPADAAYVVPYIRVQFGGAGEIHYADKISLAQGSSTVWSPGGQPATEYVCILGHTNSTPPNATYWALANPTWTGLIDKTPRDLKTFGIEAQDSWFLHQKAESERKDYFQDTATNIIKYAITDWQLLYGDDFATQDTTIQDGSLRQYAQVTSPVSGVSWAPTATGKTTWMQITGMESGRRYFMHNQAAYTTGQLVPSKIEGTFRVNAPANAPYVSGGLVVGLNTSTGACQVIELGVDTTPGAGQLANLHLIMSTITSWGATATTNFVCDGLNAGGIIAADGTSQADYQLTVLPKDAASGGFAGVRVLVNGQDIPGSTVLIPGLTLTGAVGTYTYSTNGGGTVKVRDLYAFSRSNQMTLSAGFPVTTPILEMIFNQASGLEMLMLAANAADITLRKECRKNQDILDGVVGDFAAISGGPPVIKEQFQANAAGNLISAQESDNASIFATQLKVQAISRGGFPVLYSARNLKAIRDYGLWTRMENLEDISDFRTLSAAGDAAAKLSSDPATSRTIVMEDNASTVGLWRELSTIQLQAPHLDPALANSMRQVVGFEETEGSPQKTMHLDEYPASMALSDVSQLKTSIDNLIGSALTYRVQTTPGVTQVVDDPNGNGPVYMGGGGVVGGSINFGTGWVPVGTKPGTGTTSGGNMTLIGGGPIPSGITLPLAYVGTDLDVIVSIPFNVYDHTCNILAFATLACEFASSEAYVTVQLHTGPDVNTVVNESQPTRMGSNSTLENGTAMIAPPFTSLAPGSYVAWITIKPTGAGTLVDAIGEIQIYCV